ncbi:hypothetical protein DER44DRAFT_116836 [Fusarium oxysporum]|nr:hypothetical protein DER44DRAFT_116836 [Fusarium oxysporum]
MASSGLATHATLNLLLPGLSRRVSSAIGRVSSLWSLMLVAITAAARSTKVPWPSSGLATHATLNLLLPGLSRRVSSAIGRVSSLWSLMLVAITAAARSTKVPWPSSGLATHAAFLPGFGPLNTAPIAFESSFARSLGVLVWSGIATHAARSLLTF